MLKMILHPLDSITEFQFSQEIPWVDWLLLAAIAFVGSAFYGASLSVNFPDWPISSGAIWLIASAGLAWCLFGPALHWITGKPVLTCAHACLVTMAYGEGVLASGALVNYANAVYHFLTLNNSVIFNIAIVAISNLVMCIAVAIQMNKLGAGFWKTVACWMLVLNGSGALFLIAFAELLDLKF